MKYQTAYMDPKERIRPKTINKEKSLTKQSFKDAADVNKVINRYQKTGMLTDLMAFEGQYGEMDAMSYKDAMDTVAAANSLFEQVPSEIRSKFHNDPGEFIDYATNPENHKQMAKWGLAHPYEEPIPETPIEVVIAETPPPPAE